MAIPGGRGSHTGLYGFTPLAPFLIGVKNHHAMMPVLNHLHE